jgi:probable phosphoglycerate mutase
VEIVFIRHGQPEWIRDGLNVENPPLTELGHEQAQAMADALASEHFDEVYASPLLRARQTAAPLFAALGREEQIAPWLEEIRDPAWHGTPQERAEAAYRELKGRPVDARWDGLDGGESIREFTARIRSGADRFFGERQVVRSDHDLPVWHIEESGRRIALVAHAGTNSVTIAHLLGLQPTPWEWERFVIGHTSVSRLEALELHDGFTFSLTKLSDVEHLDVGQRTR